MLAGGSPHLGFLEPSPQGTGAQIHPFTSNLDNSVIILSLRVFPAYSLLYFIYLSTLWFALFFFSFSHLF